MKQMFKKTVAVVMSCLLCLVQFQFAAVAQEIQPLAISDNLALNKSVTFSDVENGKNADGSWKYPQFVGQKVVDGDDSVNSRWSAGKTNDQWLKIDLGDEYKLGQIAISFHAEVPIYEVLISTDDIAYTPIAEVSDGSQGKTIVKNIDAKGAKARYVKFVQKKMWLHTNKQQYGTSIREISVKEFEEHQITPTTLRVGTFNIAATKKPSVDEQRALTDKYKLEIVGLQEVDKNTDRNQYDMLAKFADGVYGSNFYSKAINTQNGEYGIGTVSRYPLTEPTTTFLDSTGGKEARVYQRSVIEKDGRKIAFYNTHMSFETPAIREKQIKQIVDALKADPIPYKIVVGDFNTDQYHNEFYPFLETMDMTNGYGDKWYDTYNESDATMKVNSIDNILVSRNLKIEKVEMVPTTLSDHNLFTAVVSFLDTNAVSKEWLRAELLEAKAIKPTLYTKPSYEALQTEIKRVETLYGSTTTQQVIDDAVRSLLKTVEQLEVFNLAYQSPVTYSGVEKNASGVPYAQFKGENAVDGIFDNKDNRWSAEQLDAQWLTIDIGSIKDISEVLVYFHASVPDYELKLSTDGVVFTSVFHETQGVQNETFMKQISFPMQKARYVQFVQNKMLAHPTNGKKYGVGIREIEVYKAFAIEDIKIDNPTDAISKDNKFKIETTILPALASHKALSYESSNTSVARVDTDGNVTGVNTGKATITVFDPANPAMKKTMDIEVVNGAITVSKFIFEPSTVNYTLRDKRYLSYNVYPSNAVNPDVAVHWESSDESIVKISSEGVLEAKGVGTATITVSSKTDKTIKGELNVNITAPSYAAEYDVMKDRWLRRVLGDENMDTSDKDIASYLKNIESEGNALWASLDKRENRTFLWEKIASDTVSADYTTQFTKIKKLALAFGVKGSSLYQNKVLHNDIVKAIDFMVTTKKYNGTYSTGNWWDWQIGSTQPLVDTLMIISDYTNYKDIQLAVKAIEGYAKSPAIQWPNYTATGANRTDIGLSVLGSAILAKSDERMDLVLDKVPDVMKLVTKNDGLYADGSLIQHTYHAYNGSYGNELLKGVGKIASIMADTRWEIKDTRINNVYNTISKGYIPLMHNGQMMSMVNGRSISRAPGTNPFTTEFEAGSETISNVMLIAQFAPKPYKSEYEAAIKDWLTNSKKDFDFYGHARDFDALLSAKAIMKNTEIKEKKYYGMNVYGSMDRVVQANNNFTAGLSMYSSRLANYEFGNTENKKGWHTGDGVLYVYNNDLKQYGEGYWPTIDPYRLPGTTVDTRPLAGGAAQSKRSPQSWVGGTSDGTNGVAGMFLDSSNLDVGMNLKARKSYFFLNGKVVALGSDIQGMSPNSIETTIENRMLTSDTNKISVNGVDWTQSKENKNLGKGSTVHLSGTGIGNDIGYYFFNDQEVELQKETRTGKYEDINSYFVNDKTYTNDFFKMGINHGTSVQNGTYEYMLLPGYTKEEVQAYGQDNTVSILKNDADVQAVKDTKNNVFAMNVWADTGVSLHGITVDRAASIYTTTKGTVLRLSISNPKQNAVSLNVTVDAGYKDIISKSDKVSVNEDGSFTIDTTGSAGATHTIELNVNTDRTTLEAAIKTAKGLHEQDYTAASWADMKAALVTAIDVHADVTATQVQLDQAKDTLLKAIDALEEKPSKVVDKAELEAVITKAESKQELAYTPTSWKNMKVALTKAKSIYANANTTQKDVDHAKDELVKAIDDLKEKPSTVVDKTILEALIKEAQKFKEQDYTAASWANMKVALHEAKTVFADVNATQKEIDQATDKLLQAIKALKKHSTTPPTGDSTRANILIISMMIAGICLVLSKRKRCMKE